MDMKKSKRLLWILAAVYWALVVIIAVVAGEQFRQTVIKSDALSPAAVVGEISDGVTVTQPFTATADRVTGVELLFDTYGRANSGTLRVSITDGSGTVLTVQTVDVSKLENVRYAAVSFDTPVATQPGMNLVLVLETEGCAPGQGISVYYGNSKTVGTGQVLQEIPESARYTVSGQTGAGKLCFKMTVVDEHPVFVTVYWIVVAALFAIAAVLCLRWYKQAEQGKNNPLAAVFVLYSRYTFLLKQLVSRDFKNRYKRSVLGVAWSFLNPLLTMCVQYVVFSTLFKSDTPNYPVYLLTGILFFNYLNEAVAQGMISITGNASLIKKVFVPKYLFPMSKALSSLINFLLSLLPLLLVMLLTGTDFRWSLLLLPFDLICMVVFVLGMVLLLSTSMTFFQDTQFLWGVFSMIWMYLTPVFYPESIIPEAYIELYRLNPMYQFITFARTCIIDGISPEPMAYVKCALSALVVFGLGAWVFKKHQDAFVLQL